MIKKLWKRPVGYLNPGSRSGIKAKVKSAYYPRAHQAGAYPSFSSMKGLGVFLLPPGWDASPLQWNGCRGGLELNVLVLIYTPVPIDRGTMRVKCLAQEHNTMSLAKIRAWLAHSGVKRTNHEAIHFKRCFLAFFSHYFIIFSVHIITIVVNFDKSLY